MHKANPFKKSKYIIFFVIAYFSTLSIKSVNVAVIDILPFVLFGKFLLRKNNFLVITLLFLFVFRAALQPMFFSYVSPEFYNDLGKVLIFILMTYLFYNLFQIEEEGYYFVKYAISLGMLLACTILLIKLLNVNTGLLKIDVDGRYWWYPIGEGGNRLSILFTYLTILFLIYKGNFETIFDKFKTIFLISPFIILSFLGGIDSTSVIMIISIIIWLKPTKYIVISLVSFVIIVFIIFNLGNLLTYFSIFFDKLVGREILWSHFLDIIMINWVNIIFGLGPGGIYVTVPEFGGYTLRYTHNLFIAIWVQYGIFYMLMIIFLSIKLVKKVFYNRESTAILTLFALLLNTELFHIAYGITNMMWVLSSSYGLLFFSLNTSFTTNDKKNTYQ